MRSIDEIILEIKSLSDNKDPFIDFKLKMIIREIQTDFLGWTKVDCFLPEFGKPVLVKTKNGRYSISSTYETPKTGFRWSGSKSFGNSIVAWKYIV